ncbi:MAG: hypothetical protein KBD15_01810 [Candidatus Magasanikbacteria bacterium]|nr:hypothetical protein [Candidatus Magasanikbacteria bacterium]
MSVPSRRPGGGQEVSPQRIVDPEVQKRAEAMAETAMREARDLALIQQYIGPENVKNLAPQELDVIATRLEQELGSRLRWNNESANFKMMNDVELLFAARYDVEFVRTHQVVGGLIDTAIVLAQEKRIKSMGDAVSRIIYEDIRDGANGYTQGIYRTGLDEHGEEGHEVIDLFDELHIRHIKEVYETIPVQDRTAPYDTWAAVERLYRNERREERKKRRAEQNGTEYTRSTPKETVRFFIPKRDNEGNLVMHDDGVTPQGRLIQDLFNEVERFTISQKEFEHYYDGIGKYQTALQDLSTMRNQSTQDHHFEKAGHAQLLEGIGGQLLYLPASVLQAKSYAQGDIAKTQPSFRANGHVHEYVKEGYDENTGISIGWDPELLKIFRGSVTDHYAYGQTRQRNARAALGYGQLEDPIADAQKNTLWFGRRVLDNGKVKYGKVYDAMGNHYDREYEQARGYGMTEYEKGDKIFTNLVGRHFAINPRDWIMSYYVGTGFGSADDALRGRRAVTDNEKGEPILVFFCKLPAEGMTTIENNDELPNGNDSTIYGELTIRGFTALAKYTAWRASIGDIVGVKDVHDVKVDIMKELGKEKAKNVIDSDDATSEFENKKAIEQGIAWDHRVDAPVFGSVLGTCFGREWPAVLRILSGEEAVVPVSIAGAAQELKTEAELVEYVYSTIEEHKELLSELQQTSKEKAKRQAVLYFFDAIKKVVGYKNMLTPDMLKQHVTAEGAKDVVLPRPTPRGSSEKRPDDEQSDT